jgi:hypothetical protein
MATKPMQSTSPGKLNTTGTRFTLKLRVEVLGRRVEYERADKSEALLSFTAVSGETAPKLLCLWRALEDGSAAATLETQMKEFMLSLLLFPLMGRPTQAHAPLALFDEAIQC